MAIIRRGRGAASARRRAPAKPAKPTKPAKPARPAKPAKPANPAKPAKPTEPPKSVSKRTIAKRAPAPGKAAPARLHKGGPVPGTPSPGRMRMTPELQAHVKRLYEETDQPLGEIALDAGVHESCIRRMGPREGWVRFVAPPRGLPPLANLLAQVEALEASVKAGAHDNAGATATASAPTASTPTPNPSPQGGGEKQESAAAEKQTSECDGNIARLIATVMAHADEFEAVRRDGRLLPKQHLYTARAINILTEAFNRLQRLRAALNGTSHDIADDMPADIDAFREALAARIEKFIESRRDEAFADDVATDGPADR